MMELVLSLPEYPAQGNPKSHQVGDLQDGAIPWIWALFQNPGSLESPSLPWNCLLIEK